MRKILLLSIAILFGLNTAFGATKTSKSKNGKRAAQTKSSSRSGKRTSASRRAAIRALQKTTPTETKPATDATSATETISENTNPENLSEFGLCMDKLCKSTMADDEKGRCRCSAQLNRIEKVLRDIDKIRDEADAKNKQIETLMNVSNTAAMNDSLTQVYKNINTVEKKARNLSFKQVDAKTRLMEGLPLYNEALRQCESTLNSAPADDREGLKSDYMTLIEKDCSAYTSVLKDKADAASNLLIQAQKNEEMYNEQEHKKLNQLDTNACYVEYETCMKTQCGENFTNCLESAKQEANLKKCQAINYGKCEDNKSVVILDLKKAIKKALAKEAVAQACRGALGQIINGKCLFKVKYAADNCSILSSCGKTQEKTFNPGYTVRCDDSHGDFSDLVAGCHETCYLMGPNGEQNKIGDNRSSGSIRFFRTIGIGCSVSKHTLPVPAGWGTDGYPTDPELKKAF